MNRRKLLNCLTDSFIEIGAKFGFTQLKVITDHDITKIYLLNKCALQIEILWREYDLFMYLVNIIDDKLPNNETIYRYDNGCWCRKYIEEIYKVKNPLYTQKKEFRYTETFLHLQMEFYKELLFTDPDKFKDAVKKTWDGSIVLDDAPDNSN